MADPITALAVISAVSTVAKIGGEAVSAKEKQKALELQAEQNKLVYQQKSLSNLEVTKQVLDKQIAQSTVRGINTGMSPSFNAIQRNTLNVSSKEQKNLEIEKSLMDENIDIEKSNVKNTLFFQMFGDVASEAYSFAKLKADYGS